MKAWSRRKALSLKDLINTRLIKFLWTVWGCVSVFVHIKFALHRTAVICLGVCLREIQGIYLLCVFYVGLCVLFMQVPKKNVYFVHLFVVYRCLSNQQACRAMFGGSRYLFLVLKYR